MTVLVIAEHNNQNLSPSTLSTIGAAQKIGGDIDVIVLGFNCENVANEVSKVSGVKNVIYSDASYLKDFIAEYIGYEVKKIASNYTHILTPATSFGKNFLPRVAALMDSQQISDVIEIISPDTFKRPIYAGNAIATVQSSDPIKFLTIRATNFDKASMSGSATVRSITPDINGFGVTWLSSEISKSDRPELTAAKIVVSAGRGIGSGENYKTLIEPLADKLGAALGASRAAVDAGFVPNDYQVGQTGKVVAPELYMAIGISGAIQHLAGMKDSKVIVAINKDPEAPIFQVADYGLTADLFQAVPELTGKL